jgi:hypothetical protein
MLESVNRHLVPVKGMKGVTMTTAARPQIHDSSGIRGDNPWARRDIQVRRKLTSVLPTGEIVCQLCFDDFETGHLTNGDVIDYFVVLMDREE